MEREKGSVKSPSRGNDRGNDSPVPRAKGRSVVFKGSKVSEAPQGVDWMQTGAIKQAERPRLGGWIDIKNDIIFSS